MASINHHLRRQHLMTDDERAELRDLGWHDEVIESLFRRGFRPCKPDYVTARFEGIDISRTMGFLRQTSMPHLYITVANDQEISVVLERIDTAIYEAGREQGHSTLAGDFMRFFEHCKNWKPSPDYNAIEKRLAALEANV